MTAETVEVNPFQVELDKARKIFRLQFDQLPSAINSRYSPSHPFDEWKALRQAGIEEFGKDALVAVIPEGLQMNPELGPRAPRIVIKMVEKFQDMKVNQLVELGRKTDKEMNEVFGKKPKMGVRRGTPTSGNTLAWAIRGVAVARRDMRRARFLQRHMF